MTDLSKEGRAALRAIPPSKYVRAACEALPACLDELDRKEAEIERLETALANLTEAIKSVTYTDAKQRQSLSETEQGPRDERAT